VIVTANRLTHAKGVRVGQTTRHATILMLT